MLGHTQDCWHFLWIETQTTRVSRLIWICDANSQNDCLGSIADLGGPHAGRPLWIGNPTYDARLPNFMNLAAAFEQKADLAASVAQCLVVASSSHSEDLLRT